MKFMRLFQLFVFSILGISLLFVCGNASVTAEQTPYRFSDTFADTYGLSASTGVEAYHGSLVLKHSESNPNHYLTAGSGISVLVNPLITTWSLGTSRMRAITTGLNGYLYMVGIVIVDPYFGGETHLFEYNPINGTISDLGKLYQTGNDRTWALTTGKDGRIYGGVNGRLFVYSPYTENIDDLGIAVEGETDISALTTSTDGRIWGGSGENGHLFVYDPATNHILDKGSIKVGQSWLKSLTSGRDGKIYGGLSWNNQGRLIVYNPTTDLVTDKGQMVPGETDINTLAAGNDGKIYGGTNGFNGGAGTFFAFDPQTDAIAFTRNVGGCYTLAAGRDGYIYGGARYWWDEYFFTYNPENGNIEEKGPVVASENHLSSLTMGLNGWVYGTYQEGFYRYEPMYSQLQDWGAVSFNLDKPSGTNLRIHVLDKDDNILLTDIANGTSLASINPAIYPALKLRADLSGDGDHTPQLQDWMMSFTLNPQPDFTVEVEPISRTVPLGTNALFTTTVTAIHGFPYPVSLSVSGYHPWIRYQLSRTSLTPTGTAFMNIRVRFRAWPGTYHLFVTGSSQGLIRSSSLELNVVPLPPQTLTIDADIGGSLVITHAGILTTTLSIPPDAITTTSILTATPGVAKSIDPYIEISPSYDLVMVDHATGQPIDIAPGKTFDMQVQYDDDEYGPVIEDTLAFYYWYGEQWVKEPSSSIDPVNNILTASPTHLSRWIVMGETNRIYIPISWK